jgi:hypothetical protein
MGAGLFLLVGGFVYETMFAGLPYQDPTPEMSASYARHVRTASVLCWTGMAVLLSGGFASITRRVFRRLCPCKDL